MREFVLPFHQHTPQLRASTEWISVPPLSSVVYVIRLGVIPLTQATIFVWIHFFFFFLFWMVQISMVIQFDINSSTYLEQLVDLCGIVGYKQITKNNNEQKHCTTSVHCFKVRLAPSNGNVYKYMLNPLWYELVNQKHKFRHTNNIISNPRPLTKS